MLKQNERKINNKNKKKNSDLKTKRIGNNDSVRTEMSRWVWIICCSRIRK